MSLISILVCPDCRGGIGGRASKLACKICGREFLVREGVPILVPKEFQGEVAHEKELKEWTSYVLAVQQIMDSLPRDRAVLDIGSGNRAVNDPRIVRLDIFQSPHVDVVGDAHQLPFADNTFDFVYATAVFEHLHHPFQAALEILRVLRPGGLALVDCNFVYPFHGYPAVYFNASGEGMKQLFADFTEVKVYVAPWNMPSFALEALIAEYLRLFPAENEEERSFVEALKALDRFPIRTFDARFRPADAARIAAGTTLIGTKPTLEPSGIIPKPILDVYSAHEELRRRYPKPGLLVSDFVNERIVSLLSWAFTEGRSKFPEVAEVYDRAMPFSKSIV